MDQPAAMPADTKTEKFAARAALLLLALSLLGGLAALAYAGTYARYWGDDYCYASTVMQSGLVRGMIEWYNVSGNRLSTLVVVALSELGGPRDIQWNAAGLLVIWAAGWYVFLRASGAALAAGLRLERDPGRLWTAALALLLTYFTFLLSPDRFQTLYWRMGSLHYSLPAPLLLFNLALLLRKGRGRWAWLVGVFSALLAFFTAGLSETFAALQASLFIALIALALLAGRRLPANRGLAAARLLVFPLFGSLAMMLVMALAPANAWRQAVLPPPDNPLVLLPYSLRYAAQFIFFSMRGAPVPFLVFLCAAFGLGWLLPAGRIVYSGRVTTRWALAGVLGSLLMGYLLVAASFSPSAFAGLSYPAGRAQMPGHAAWMFALGCAALLAGAWARGWAAGLRFRWINTAQTAATVLILLGAALYPLRAAATVRFDLDRLTARAARWDDRDVQIRAARAAGERDLLVRQTDVVLGLEDMGPDPEFWINRCAAAYYDVDSITARP